MNALNLTLINESSPYEVWQTSEGDFNFETDFGVLYRISFRIEQTIWEDGAYEFTLNQTKIIPHKKEKKPSWSSHIGQSK